MGSSNGKKKKPNHTFLELKAAFYGLKYYSKNLGNINILLIIDNSTPISYINSMESVRFLPG